MNTTLIKMAFRNLVKNQRRTLITLLGIAFGVMISILFTGLQDATWRETINTAAELGAGHVVLQQKDYLDEPSVSNRLSRADIIARMAAKDSRIRTVRERVVSHAMVATAANSTSAMIYGINPQTDTPDNTRLLKGKLVGKPLKSGDSQGVIIGAELAERLNLKPGQKLVYTLTDTNGEIVSALGRVRGVLHTGSRRVDQTLCMVDMNGLRRLLGYRATDVTQLAVFLTDYRDSKDVARALSASLVTSSFAGTVQALPWETVNADLFGLVQTKMASAHIFELLILFLVAAGIFNTLYVSVMERMREFGILNALGFSRPRIFSLVIWESVFTAIGGLALALLVTAWPYYHMNTTGLDLAKMAADGKEMVVNDIAMNTVIHVDIYFEKLLSILAVAAGATLLSGLYPAWRAGNVVPVESIKLV
ncbi:MAG: ABC transporter permease [Deltaproteobacteria bacterium]|nr:ABC transporter permease [Deltaproteobacteria bacterium]